MKKVFIFVALALIIIIAAILILISQKNKQSSTLNTMQGIIPSLPSGGTASTTPTSSANSTNTSSGEAPSGEKITVKGQTGKVSVNDFKKNAEVASSGVIYFVDKKEYNIAYNSTSSEFIMTLLVNTNIESTRKDAENDLLSSLGISQQDACKLRVYLYVSAAINKNLSDNHGLSFCPGSKFFPN